MSIPSSSTAPADLFLDRLVELDGPDAKATFERAVLMYMLEHGERGIARLAIAAGLRAVQERVAAGHCEHCGRMPADRHAWHCPRLLHGSDFGAVEGIPSMVPSQRLAADALAAVAERAVAQIEARRQQLPREVAAERPWWRRWLPW